MYKKQQTHVNHKENTTLKLTNEELKPFSAFQKLEEAEQENLKELIYNLSMIIYKSFINEQA